MIRNLQKRLKTRALFIILFMVCVIFYQIERGNVERWNAHHGWKMKWKGNEMRWNENSRENKENNRIRNTRNMKRNKKNKQTKNTYCEQYFFKSSSVLIDLMILYSSCVRPTLLLTLVIKSTGSCCFLFAE